LYFIVTGGIAKLPAGSNKVTAVPLPNDFRFGGQITADPAGDIYVAVYSLGQVRKLAAGTLTIVAGLENPAGYRQDLPTPEKATERRLGQPSVLAFDPKGDLYIGERIGTGQVYKLTVATGTIAGLTVDPFALNTRNGGISDRIPGRTPFTAASQVFPTALAVSPEGEVNISDFGHPVVWKNAAGVTTRVAGNGYEGFSGDGGPATSAQLSAAQGLAFDAAGNLYIAANNRVRKVAKKDGTITTVVGPSADPEKDWPNSMVFDRQGNLYTCGNSLKRIPAAELK
jgi:hypothetical protein